MVSAFEENKAETMLPVIETLMAAHQLPDVTIVAGAGNLRGEPGGHRGRRAAVHPGHEDPACPHMAAQWRRGGGAGAAARRSRTGRSSPSHGRPGLPREGGIGSIYYQYRHDGARKTLRGIDEQVAMAGQAVAGTVPVRGNRFVRRSGGTSSVNRELEDKARALARPERLRHEPDRLPGRRPGHR